MRYLVAMTALLLGWSVGASAAEPRSEPRVPPDAQLVMNSDGFLGAHPDLRWRREGVIALQDDRAAEAFNYFKRSARYADKASQAMVAEMLWTGTGTPMDRPLAYAWMDIAAERAYIPFVAKREQYWSALDEAGRSRALEVGRPLYDEYRDAVAKARLERELDRGKRNVTGSRVGHVGNLQIMIPDAGGMMMTTIDGARFYDDTFWEPERYWAWQDSIWMDAPTGTVTVEALEVVRDDAEDDDR